MDVQVVSSRCGLLQTDKTEIPAWIYKSLNDTLDT